MFAAGAGDRPLHDRAPQRWRRRKGLIALTEPPSLGRVVPRSGFWSSGKPPGPSGTCFSMDNTNTAATDQPRPPPVTAERIADAFESYARKLAEAGVPLDRIAEGLSMAAVRAEVAHRDNLMHKLQAPWQLTSAR